MVLQCSFLAALLLVAVTDSAAPQEEAPARPCSAPEYRQFDFWVGEWEVEANGNIVGRSRVSRILDDCVILEEWESAGNGFEGKSFNRYDAKDGRWHQQWVDNRGAVLDLIGERTGDQMVLSGERRGADGNRVLQRITWTANEDGTVRQLWASSHDEGESWTTLFDGLYRRLAP